MKKLMEFDVLTALNSYNLDWKLSFGFGYNSKVITRVINNLVLTPKVVQTLHSK
jgi:hypothetical protein